MEAVGKKITLTVSNDLVTDQRMHRMATSLVDLGYKVILVGRILTHSLPLEKKSFEQFRLKLFFNKGPLFYLNLNLRLFIFHLKFKPNVVYSVDADTVLSGIWYKKITKGKLVFDAHELFSEVPELMDRYGVKAIWRQVEKWAILNSDLRITVSESIAAHFTQLYKKPFIVIRNLPYYHVSTRGQISEKYMVYQGALNEGRGLEQLIEAAQHLKLPIKMVGDGDLREKLIEMAKDSKNIEFLGNISPENLKLITQNAWLGYNLLNNRSLSYHYSLSNKTFDYMQAGIPQLMSELPEYKKLNDQWRCGLFVKLDSEQIVKAVNGLLADNNLYESLCQQALLASQSLNWENESLQLRPAFINLTSK